MSARTRASSAGGGGKGDYTYIVEQMGATTTVYDHNGNVAHGPGVNNEAEINWALANLTVGRTEMERVVVFGEFTINNPIVVPSFSFLDLTMAEIFLANTSNCKMIQNSDLVNGNTYIKILGGILNGNRANQAAGDGVYFVRVWHAWILDMTILNIYSRGIVIWYVDSNNSKDILIQGNYLNNMIEGIRFDTAWSIRVIGNNIGEVIGSTGYGIREWSSKFSVIADNTLYSTGGMYGIFLDGGVETVIVGNSIQAFTKAIYCGGNAFTITGNHMDGHKSGGIQLASTAQNNTVTGNQINDPNGTSPGTQDGIVVSGDHNIIACNVITQPIAAWRVRHGIYVTGEYNVIEGNTMVATGSDGINLTGASNNLVVGNRITDAGAYGIQLDAVSSYNSIENNYTDGSVTACLRINNANCINNVITNNQFDEGNISDVGGAHNCHAWLNYDPSANAFITTINAPVVVGGGGGALP